MPVKQLTAHHTEFLSLKGGYTGSSESTFVKMPHCWKSHAAAQVILLSKWMGILNYVSSHRSLKAAKSVTFDFLILEIMFLFFKNTAKN